MDSPKTGTVRVPGDASSTTDYWPDRLICQYVQVTFSYNTPEVLKKSMPEQHLKNQERVSRLLSEPQDKLNS
jgi:hypothetical protein